MMVCDLCNSSQALCVERSIEGKDYDICERCWKPLEEKFKGKGRVQRKRDDAVFVPHPQITIERQDEDTRPRPGERPKIF